MKLLVRPGEFSAVEGNFLNVGTWFISILRFTNKVEVAHYEPVYIIWHFNVFEPINELAFTHWSTRGIYVSECPGITIMPRIEINRHDKVVGERKMPIKETIIPAYDHTTRGSNRGNKSKVIKLSWTEFFDES